MTDFFSLNGIDPAMYTYRFPAVDPEHFPVAWLPEQVREYIEKLETALGQCEHIIERLNTDRMEQRRILRMRDYLEGMTHG